MMNGNENKRKTKKKYKNNDTCNRIINLIVTILKTNYRKLRLHLLEILGKRLVVT